MTASGHSVFGRVLASVVFLVVCLLLSSFAAAADLSSLVTVTKSERSITDRRTMMVTTTATIKIVNNSTQSIAVPIHGVFDISSTVVTVPDAIAPGTGNPYNKYYVDLSSKVSGGSLTPGASVSFTVNLVCKSTVRYSYKILTYGTIPVGNQAPIANAGPNQSITLSAGQSSVSVQLDGSLSRDSDGTVASYIWSGTPKPADVVAPTVTLNAGVYVFTLQVRDNLGAMSGSSPVTITVLQPPKPRPPQVTLSSLTHSVNQGLTLTFTVTGTSPDGRGVALSASPAMANATFVATPGTQATGTFSFTPSNSQTGIYLVSFQARDSLGLTDIKTAQVTINKVNHPPVVSIAATATVDEGKSLVIPVTASDPDGDILTLTATGLPNRNAVFIPSTGAISFTPDYTQAGSYSVTVRANDGSSSSTATVTITVNDVPTGGTGQPGEWTLNVDPVDSPAFLATQRITGSVGTTGVTPVVQPAKTALITGMNPASAEQGKTIDVVLTGDTGNYATHFASGTSKAVFGTGITVNSLNIDIAKQEATVNVTIAGDANVGPRSANIVTGGETALSVNAFNVLKGKSSVTGRLVDPTTGQAIAGATVVIQGTNITAITNANGYFTLEGLPTGPQIVMINSSNREFKTISLDARSGVLVDIGEMKLNSTVFDPAAPSSGSIMSIFGRGMAEFIPSTKNSEDLKKMVIDSILMTGGKSCGVIDEFGNQLNTEITGNGVVSLTSAGVSVLAERWITGEVTSLGSLLQGFMMLFEWPSTPSLVDTVRTMQTLVDSAWLDSQDPNSAMLIAIFNRGRSVSLTAPRLNLETPLNTIQSYLLVSSMFAWATNEMDYRNFNPQRLSPIVGTEERPIMVAFNDMGLHGAVVTDAPSPRLFAQNTGTKPVAYAGPDQHIEVPQGTKSVRVTLSGSGYLPSGGNITGYYWYRMTAGDPEPTIGEQTVTVNLTSGGNHIFRLYIEGAGMASEPSEVSIFITGDCGFTTNFDKSTASWCKVFNKVLDKASLKLMNLPVDNAISKLSEALKPLVLQKPSAEKMVYGAWLKFVETANPSGSNVPRLRQAYEMEGMKNAYKNMKAEAATFGAEKQFISNAAAIVKKGLTTIIGSFADMILDPVFNKLIDGIIEYSRPSPPFIQKAQLDDTPEGEVMSQHVKVTFKPSPSDLYDSSHPESIDGIRKYAYLIYRNNERIDIVHTEDFKRDANKDYTYIDSNPRMGTNFYNIGTRVIRSNTVPNTNQVAGAFEARYITDMMIGKVPGADYTSRFFWKSLDSIEKILRGLILQDSDLTEPEMVYVGATTRRMHPTLELAVDKSVVPNVNYLSIPDTSGIFKVLQEGIELYAFAGFKEPFQAGLAIDAMGTLFSENAASDAQFGGRIFRFTPSKTRELAGTVNYYSPTLQYARPASVAALTYGIDGQGEALFIADGVDQAVKRLDVTPGRMVGLYDRNVGQFYAQSPEFFFQGNTKMHFDVHGTLFLTQGPDLFRISRNVGGSNGVQKVFADNMNPFEWLTGIDSDPLGNYYIADFSRGDITMVPYHVMASGTFMNLDESIRRRYLVMQGLSNPVDLKITNGGRGIIVVDGAGLHQKSFGITGRIFDSKNGIFLAGADVIANNGMALGKTDAQGFFHVADVAASNTPLGIRLKVVSIDGRTQVFPNVRLADYGHTALMDDLQFDPPELPPTGPAPTGEAVIDPDPFPAEFNGQLSGNDLGSSIMRNFVIPDRRIYLSTNAPPAPPAAVMKNDLDFLPLALSAVRPVVSIISPATRLVTSNGSVALVGMVSPGQVISEVRVFINGEVRNITPVNGIFRTTVLLREGINIITARAGSTVFDPATNTNYQEGVSEAVQISRSTTSSPSIDYVGVVGLTDGSSITSATDVKVQLYAVIDGVDTLVASAVTKSDGSYRIHVDGKGPETESEKWLLDRLTNNNAVTVKLVTDNYAE